MAEDKQEGFKLSFGAGASKSRAKRVRVNEEAERPLQEFVTGISEAGLALRDGEATSVGVNGSVQKVIPNLGNDLRGLGPKAFNSKRFLPQKDDIARADGGEDRFEVAAPEERPTVKYGLTVFKDEDEDPQQSAPRENGQDHDRTQDAGDDARGRRVLGTGRDWESEAFQSDIGRLPDQASLEEYEAMPVEAFGAAMLRGMGWSEEQESVEAQAKEFVRRAPLLGLGATAAPQPVKEKRFIKPGESREARKELVVYDSQGNLKHTRTAGEQLVERVAAGAVAGKVMRIRKGRHEGLLCRVRVVHDEVLGHSQKAEVCLLPSEEIVTVRTKDLDERKAAAPPPPAATAATSRKDSDGRKEKNFSAKRSGGREAKPNGRHESRDSELAWLSPHIRVKVIDKHLGKGRLYLKKGEITDVLTPKLCSLSMDSRERVEAAQDQLETVIPRQEGARLLVVRGRFRGARAKLLKRSTEGSQAAIQLLEDFSVHKVGFDEISEFVGDLGEEE